MSRLRIILAAVIASTLGAASAGTVAAQVVPSASAEVAVLSKYLWRGGVLTEGFVVQPSATAGLGQLELGVWANMDQDDVNTRSGEFTEVDYSVSCTFAAGGFELSAGGVRYTFTQDGVEGTTELYAGVTSGWFLAPSFTAWRDVDEGNGTYLSLGVGQSWPVGPLSLDLAAAGGWGDRAHNEYNYGVATAGVTDFQVTASTDLTITRFVTVRPTVGYTRLLGSELRDAAGKPDNFLAGLTVAFGF